MSKEKLYSIGIVAEDSILDSDIIKVYPVEKLTGNDNKPLNEEVDETVSVVTDEGTETIKIKSCNFIKATWRSKSSYNRLTHPTVRAGETVDLYRYSNSDIFYWDTANNDHTLRKQERIVYGFSVKEEVDKEEPIEDLYTFTVDTFEQFMQLLTTALNGEKTTYDIKLDTAKGIFHFIDGNGNYFKWNTPEDTWDINVNKDINITNGKNITIKNGNDVIIENGNDINIKNANNIILENGGDITIVNKGNIGIENSGTIDVDSTGAVTVKSPTVTLDTPLTTMTGNVVIKGNLAVTGISTLTGAVTSAGVITGSGVVAPVITGGSISMGVPPSPLPTLFKAK